MTDLIVDYIVTLKDIHVHVHVCFVLQATKAVRRPGKEAMYVLHLSGANEQWQLRLVVAMNNC